MSKKRTGGRPPQLTAAQRAKSSHEAKMLALKALENEQGEITPSALVESARSDSNPWHDRFEWNDTKAAHMHRIITAREILRTWTPARIERETITFKTVSYVRNPNCSGREQGYVNIARVRDDEDMKREVLIAEFDRARSALQRAYDVADALDARDQIADLIARINRLRAERERPGARL